MVINILGAIIVVWALQERRGQPQGNKNNGFVCIHWQCMLIFFFRVHPPSPLAHTTFPIPQRVWNSVSSLETTWNRSTAFILSEAKKITVAVCVFIAQFLFSRRSTFSTCSCHLPYPSAIMEQCVIARNNYHSINSHQREWSNEWENDERASFRCFMHVSPPSTFTTLSHRILHHSACMEQCGNTWNNLKSINSAHREWSNEWENNDFICLCCFFTSAAVCLLSVCAAVLISLPSSSQSSSSSWLSLQRSSTPPIPTATER